MVKLALKSLSIFLLLIFINTNKSISQTKHDLQFNDLAKVWYEGIPLGNGMLGELVWQNDKKLRLSLDRADLWDLRPVLELKSFNYNWVCEQVGKNQYEKVQELGDTPYIMNPAPTKIPGAALEFEISSFGKVSSVDLYLDKALCVVKWEKGAILKTFVHASLPVGFFRFENIGDSYTPVIKVPDYSGENKVSDTCRNATSGGLEKLKYLKGEVFKSSNKISYIQPGWNGFAYKVVIEWQQEGSIMEGAWSISTNLNNASHTDADYNVRESLRKGFDESFMEHEQWWDDFWGKSSISIPDEILEKQWYLEIYKFGSASRKGAPPISLQAIWTADNGALPPWKGDYHNDLNTQLSYWPAYSSNHLAEEKAFTDWLWSVRDYSKSYTKRYFGTNGLAIAGVSTLTGEEMGGWIQYSLSPTVSAWLAHHFYLEWKYSMDKNFLRDTAYPFIKEVAILFEELTIKDNGLRKLPLSSSPEINDNGINAWFTEMTNFDLSLIRWTYGAAAEMATVLGMNAEAEQWKSILKEFPELNISKDNELTIAPGFSLPYSHRHFSHLMSIFPLGTTDFSNGTKDSLIIMNSLKELENKGSAAWCGYSYSWLGCLYARAKQGQKAADSLRVFASCYCSPNSFHLNGNQCKKEDHPFTLEGNFAFAAAIQEMLIQSHSGTIEIFPAIPPSWKDISFNNLRTEGAFLVSVEMKNGVFKKIQVISEKGGKLKLKIPGKKIIEKQTLAGQILNIIK